MVKSYPDLDATFSALADPTRRAILARLAKEPGLSVTGLAEPMPMSLPAVMKHLEVLARAGLVRRRKLGRVVRCEADTDALARAAAWLMDQHGA